MKTQKANDNGIPVVGKQVKDGQIFPFSQLIEYDGATNKITVKADLSVQGDINISGLTILKVQSDDIDSGEQPARKILASDGEGGASWTTMVDNLPASDVSEGNIISIAGFDEDGELVKGAVPTGTVSVDSAMSDVSENPVQNKVIKAYVDDLQDNLENGTIVVSKATVAKQIENISEESGTTQETPFILQGTATANNTDPVDTGPIGKNIEKQGNSVVVNQLVINGNFANTSNWSSTRCDFAVSSNVASLTPNAQSTSDNYVNQDISMIVGHKYLFVGDVKGHTANNYVFYIFFGAINNLIGIKSILENVWETKYAIIQCLTNEINKIRMLNNSTDTTKINYFKNINLIDLTQWFGSNDAIPQDLLDHPEHWAWYQNYGPYIAYNTGTLVNCDGRYLECGGRNVWDEEWEVGIINNDTGQNEENPNVIRSKNYTRVIPNTQYYVNKYANNSGVAYVFMYDENKNYLDKITFYNADSGVFTTSSNCAFIRFRNYATYGTTYNHDITISLYYTTGDGYNEYYAYQEPNVYDTGTEVLRSAGSVKDTKAPDGTITRNVDKLVVDGVNNTNMAVATGGNGAVRFTVDISNAKAPLTSATVVDTITSRFKRVSFDTIDSGVLTEDSVALYSSSRITFYVVGKTTLEEYQAYFESNPLTVNYGKAEPTTEQGTPFAENIGINDYGPMGWLDTDSDYVDIPQGLKIFYRADYVLYIDSLIKYTDGSVDNLALQSDVSTVDNKHDALYDIVNENLGGILRHQLTGVDFNNTAWVDLGSLEWSKGAVNDNYVFYSEELRNLIKIPSANTDVAKIISSKYKTSAYQTIWSNFVNGLIAISASGDVNITDMTYSDATAFKSAMKGVLLAYEKASEE